MKIIFMGTPDFAVCALEALIAAGHEIALVATQPDKPKGRGKSMQYPPVKTAALAHNIEIYQPKKIRDAACVEFLKIYAPDLIVVAAFGQILPKDILTMPKYGCINIHASLLPKYRGAAPIQWAVLNGEAVTGITIMQMDEGLDTGDILLQKEIELNKEETGGSLFQKLAKEGASLCVKAISQIEQGMLKPIKQDESSATYTGKITKEMGRLDWREPAAKLERMVRGLNPWPGAYTSLNEKTLKIWKARVMEESELGMGFETKLGIKMDAQPGEVALAKKSHLVIKTGEGWLSLEELQLEGKKRMRAEAFLCGASLRTGTILG